MPLNRRRLLQVGGAAAVAASGLARAADAPVARQPIIDVHMHAYPLDMALPDPLANPITGKPSKPRNGAEHLNECVAEMKRHNVVKGVVSGGDGDRLKVAMQWHERDPGRFIAGAGVRGSEDTPLPSLDELRKAFTERKLQVLGEVTAQYAGLTLSDAKYDAYLSLAEQLDVPVALHTGTMPPGITTDPCCRTARAHFGNPRYVEEALNRHPKLRLNLMHAGWPYLEDTIATLFEYPNVNADLGAIDWLLPRAEFHAYLGALMRAGFGKRLMFGSDNMFWPEAIGMAIEGVESAPFLSSAEKRDIFYGNAVRFYKLDLPV
jgi:predicted TIM-barrel fold metal-dependent hydrolase